MCSFAGCRQVAEGDSISAGRGQADRWREGHTHTLLGAREVTNLEEEEKEEEDEEDEKP